MTEQLLTITQAAEFLGVSLDTLRRWDKVGKLVATHKDGGTHRYYRQHDLELYMSDLFALASEWAMAGGDISNQFYCANSAVFQSRLIKMQGA
jgi:excisionase family DNA binding protein